jgi:hypothetical protein
MTFHFVDTFFYCTNNKIKFHTVFPAPLSPTIIVRGELNLIDSGVFGWNERIPCIFMPLIVAILRCEQLIVTILR